MKSRLFALGTILCLAWPAAALAENTISLSQFEKFTAVSPVVESAKLSHLAARSAVAMKKAQRGPSLSGGVNTGEYRELVTQNVARTYHGIDGAVSLRIPLSSGRGAEDTLAEENAQLAQSENTVVLARRDVLKQIRVNYANYWAAGQVLRLSNTLLGNEASVRRAITLRMQQHVILPSVAFHMVAQYEQAHTIYNAAQRSQQWSLAQLALLTGHSLAPFVADPPDLNVPCDNQSDFMQAVVDTDATVRDLHRQRLENQRFHESHATLPLETNMLLGQTYTAQSPNSTGIGRASTLGLNIAMPLQESTIETARTTRYQALQARLEIDENAQLDRVRAVADDSSLAFTQSMGALRNAQAQRVAASEVLRETEARFSHTSAVTIDTLADARFTFFNAAVAEINARADAANRKAELMGLADDACTTPASSVVITQMTLPKVWTYAWKTQAILEEPSDKTVASLINQHVNGILLSFNADQLKSLTTDVQSRSKLVAFLQEAHAQHVAVGLLLGEPSWIMPKGREGLVHIIQSMASYDFDELHLDIEPQQLHSLSTPAHVRYEFGKTLAAAVEASRWPVDVSMHYKDMTEPAADPRDSGTAWHNYCLTCDLARMRIAHVTLMTYVADYHRVLELVTPIIAANPSIRFRVAQSVEGELSTEESYKGKTMSSFLRSMSGLIQSLSLANFDNIVVQSLSEYKEMTP